MLLGHQFLAALGTRCIERPGDESEGRALIEEFVRDALLLLERPEWPAAELCLQLLSVSLCRRITRQKHKKRTRIFPHVSHAVLFPSVSHAVLFPSVSYAVPFLCVTRHALPDLADARRAPSPKRTRLRAPSRLSFLGVSSRALRAPAATSASRPSPSPRRRRSSMLTRSRAIRVSTRSASVASASRAPATG